MVGAIMVSVGAILGGGGLIMLPFGALMIFTGSINVCPMGSMYSQSLKGQ